MILSKLLGLKNLYPELEALSVIQNDLPDDYDINSEEGRINIGELIRSDEETFIQNISSDSRFNRANLETLADIFVAIAQKSLDPITQHICYHRSLLIYDHLEITEKTFSIEHNDKKRAIETLLNNEKIAE